MIAGNERNKNIVTGQQLGLLGGPLYTTYKVLGTIKHSERIDGHAIYWLETNDSDFDEIKHMNVLDKGNNLKRIEWKHEPTGGLSCGLITTDDSLRKAIEEFFSLIRQTEFTPELKTIALDCYAPGHSLSKASLLLARELFGKFDIDCFDPSCDDFRHFSRPILLKEAGMTRDGEQGNFFVVADGKRLAVFKRGEKWVARDNGPVDIHSFALVPNLKTRNLCQDLYFRTHTYIAGPGEQKYIAELDDIYARHGARKAAVKKRMSVTLIEPNVKRKLLKLSLESSNVINRPKDKFLKEVFLLHSSADLSGLEERINEHTNAYFEGIELDGISLPSDFKREVVKATKRLLGKIRSEEKVKAEFVMRQASSVSNALFPFNTHQDRVFTVFQYMNLYGGLEFIDWLYEKYDESVEFLEIQGGEYGSV